MVFHNNMGRHKITREVWRYANISHVLKKLFPNDRFEVLNLFENRPWQTGCTIVKREAQVDRYYYDETFERTGYSKKDLTGI